MTKKNKKNKKILGLTISGPTTFFSNGRTITSPSVTGWALVEENPSKMKKKTDITEIQVIEEARLQIGSYLKAIREEKELTFYAVGKNAGLSIEQVQSIEKGKKAYTIDSFLRICRALDCYFFLESRDGEHLNEDDMLKKI